MIPSATYRIQFRNGMTFDRVVGLVPYLKDLGISTFMPPRCLLPQRIPRTAMTSPTRMK